MPCLIKDFKIYYLVSFSTHIIKKTKKKKKTPL